MKKSRVLLADDHRLFAEGLQSLLKSHFDVVGIRDANVEAEHPPRDQGIGRGFYLESERSPERSGPNGWRRRLSRWRWRRARSLVPVAGSRWCPD